MKNKTGRKTLDFIENDERIMDAWHEGKDGIWIGLNENWNWKGCCTVHEWTVKDIIRELKNVKEGKSDGNMTEEEQEEANRNYEAGK